MTYPDRKSRRRRRFLRTRLTKFELTFMLSVIGGGIVLAVVLLFLAVPPGAH